MTKLELFTNPEFGEIRMIDIDGKPYAAATDTAKMLGYRDPNDAIKRHCRYPVKRRVPHPQSANKTIEINFISEGDLYRLISHSQLPSAERFELWIFDEVLPTIRKHGAYITAPKIEEILENPDIIINLATTLKEERAKAIALEAELDRSKEWYSIKRVASINGVSWKSFDWRKLKRASEETGLGVKKIFDANYGEVNIYHQTAWEKAYPQYEI